MHGNDLGLCAGANVPHLASTQRLKPNGHPVFTMSGNLDKRAGDQACYRREDQYAQQSNGGKTPSQNADFERQAGNRPQGPAREECHHGSDTGARLEQTGYYRQTDIWSSGCDTPGKGSHKDAAHACLLPHPSGEQIPRKHCPGKARDDKCEKQQRQYLHE